MVQPKVSVITVVYNAKDLFSKTLESIKELRYENKEIIVIDGGSTDGTREVIEQNSLHINRWISEPDNGIYDAMNKALRIATGEYVWFINAGDYPFSPYTLENIFKGQEIYADIYYGDTLIRAEDGEILGLRKKRPPHRLAASSFKRGMVVCHQSFIARKKLLRAFDLKYRHTADFDQMIRAVKRAKSIRRIDAVISVFTEGGHTSAFRKEGWKERFEIMQKNFGLFPTLLAHARIALRAPFARYRKFRGIVPADYADRMP